MSDNAAPASKGSCKPPSTSTFSFTAPPPPSATPLKLRRVSLALPSSPRLVPAWSFRDDTAVNTSSDMVPTKRGKMRKIASDEGEDEQEPSEKKPRKKWTQEETQMLVDGCNTWGVGNWKAILKDSTLKFDNRSPVDLKDRFRTYFPDAYKIHYPNAKTHLSSKIRSTLPDGSSLFEKTRSKKRRPFTEEEDRALKAGYEKHGTVWATIVKDPIFQEQNRRSTDLRDRFRNAFPHLYQAAGYKPRGVSKKKQNEEVKTRPLRAATDDQLAISSAGVTHVRSPARRRRAQTSQGLLRGGTKSVPQSVDNSEDEDSSGGEEVAATFPGKGAARAHPNKRGQVADSGMEAIDPLPGPMPPVEPISLSEFTLSPLQVDISDSQTSQSWSTGVETPVLPGTSAWSSTTAGSPTSSHISSDYLMAPLSFRRADFGMIGKSAWGTNDWFSANPRLDSTASSGTSSFIGGLSPTPSSPFSFHTLSHGVMDRYDLLPTSYAHDFASEVGVGDSHSTFSDADAFAPSGFWGFTHHSDYAGDLIFGSRTHQPHQPHQSLQTYGSGFGFGTLGLGLSDVSQSAGIHPMQLHTPVLPLPGIEEIEQLTLNDQAEAPLDRMDGTHESISARRRQHQQPQQPKDDPDALVDVDLGAFALPQHNLDDLVNLPQELHTTPPATPLTQPQPLRSLTSFSHLPPPMHHPRSVSVPPSEHRAVPPTRPIGSGHIHSAPHVGATRSLPSFGHVPVQDLWGPASLLVSTPHDVSRAPHDLYDLPFLDLHYHMGTLDAAPLADQTNSRQGQALDLAQSTATGTLRAMGIHPPPLAPPPPPALNPSVPPRVRVMGRTHSLHHHRGQSAASPQDLALRKSNDNKRKRASWDGGAF